MAEISHSSSLPGFLSLPSEIRLFIYRYFFIPINIEVAPVLRLDKCPECGEEHTIVTYELASYWDPRRAMRDTSNLLKVNKLINAEATAVYHSRIDALTINPHPYEDYKTSECKPLSDLAEDSVPMNHIRIIEMPFFMERGIYPPMFRNLSAVYLVDPRGWIEISGELMTTVRIDDTIEDKDMIADLEEEMADVGYASALQSMANVPGNLFSLLPELELLALSIDVFVDCEDESQQARLVSTIGEQVEVTNAVSMA